MIEPKNKNPDNRSENATQNQKTSGERVRDRERSEKEQSTLHKRINKKQDINSGTSDDTRTKHLADEVKETKTKATSSSKKKTTIGWIAGGVIAALAGLGIYKARAKSKDKGKKEGPDDFGTEHNTDYDDADLEKDPLKGQYRGNSY